MTAPDAGKNRPPAQRLPTRLESVDEIRAALQARQAELLDRAGLVPASGLGFVGAPPAAAGTPPVPPVAHASGSPAHAPGAPAHAPGSPPEVSLYRPSQRPPVALLCVLDDGGDDGEWVRLRGERFVIGRANGDLVLPHDNQISGRHAELVRQRDEDGSWVWLLTDLNSTNGTFVRAGSALLKDRQEFIVGRTRYRFEAPQANPPVADAPGSSEAPTPAGGTISWDSQAAATLFYALVELTPAGPGARVPLVRPECWVGSDAAACAAVPANDPFVSPKHAKLTRDAKGRWHVANNRSVNGVWLRVEQMPLAGSCQLQLGEQRFLFKVP
jgi:hypothetical protein